MLQDGGRGAGRIEIAPPYGAGSRPVAVTLTKYELEKLFRRA